MRKRIYIAGPITMGDRVHNLAQAQHAFHELLLGGFAPLAPQLTMLLPYAWDVPHDVWMLQCEPWVIIADAVLRLPGYSKGSDQEEVIAKAHGVPVFYDMESLREWSK